LSMRVWILWCIFGFICLGENQIRLKILSEHFLYVCGPALFWSGLICWLLQIVGFMKDVHVLGLGFQAFCTSFWIIKSTVVDILRIWASTCILATKKRIGGFMKEVHVLVLGFQPFCESFASSNLL
jgi:hypothetical protein